MRGATREFSFLDGQVWQVQRERVRGTDLLHVRLVHRSDGGDALLARLSGSPFDPSFQERFASIAASRNNADPAAYPERMLAIADEIIPAHTIAQKFTHPPDSGGAHMHTPPKGGDVCSAAEIAPGVSYEPDLASVSEPAQRAWVVQEIVPCNRATVFFGSPGALKSTIAAHLAVSVAAGLPWLKHNTQQGSVWVLDFEEDLDEVWRRLKGISVGLGLAAIPRNISYFGFHVPLLDAIDGLGRLAQSQPPVLIVVDSLNPAVGADPDRAENILPVFQAIREVGCSWVLVDHETKLQAKEKPLAARMPYGSFAKGAQSRSAISFVQPAPQAFSGAVLLVHQKSSYAAPFDPIPLIVKRDAGRVCVDAVSWKQPPFDKVKRDDDGKPQVATGRGMTASDKILVALAKAGAPIGPIELVAATGLDRGTQRNALLKLIKAGEMVKSGARADAKYSLQSQGAHP
jgi:hypothetical protein